MFATNTHGASDSFLGDLETWEKAIAKTEGSPRHPVT